MTDLVKELRKIDSFMKEARERMAAAIRREFPNGEQAEGEMHARRSIEREAADEIERLQALYDREKAARYISIDEAIAEARRQAFIEAAEHLEASGEWKSVPIGPYGAATAEWDGPSVHELAAVLRAKAEETQG